MASVGGFGRDQNAFGSGCCPLRHLLSGTQAPCPFSSCVDWLHLPLCVWLPHSPLCRLPSAYMTQRPWHCTSSPISRALTVVDSVQLGPGTPVVRSCQGGGEIGLQHGLPGSDCVRGSFFTHSFLLFFWTHRFSQSLNFCHRDSSNGGGNGGSRCYCCMERPETSEGWVNAH